MKTQEMLIALGLFFSANVFAQSPSLQNANSNETFYYWDQHHYKNAKPMQLPKVIEENLIPIAIKKSNANNIYAPSQEPMMDLPPEKNLLFIPSVLNKIRNFNAGTSKYQFSSTQLIPLTADLNFPYRAVGKLFFTTPSGDKSCTAVVIKKRIILTAAHCLHDGSGSASGWYKNFIFIPAFRDGVAPYKAWTYSFAKVTNDWFIGKGVVPNAADYGMLEMNDLTINNKVTSIAAVTGYLGYKISSTIPNHTRILGFPCNLDFCQKMHEVDAQSAASVTPNNVEIGSDMNDGAGGSPWIQNFGKASDGQANNYLNVIVGVTSYAYDDTTTLVNGSSILDSRFTTLLNDMCAHRAGNCG